MNRPSFARQRGFSLIEFATVLGLVGILIALAVPLTSAWSDKQRLRLSARTVANAFAHARGEAIRTGDIHAVFFEEDADGNTLASPITVLNDGAPGEATQNCDIDGGEEVVEWQLERGVDFGVTHATAKVPTDPGRRRARRLQLRGCRRQRRHLGAVPARGHAPGLLQRLQHGRRGHRGRRHLPDRRGLRCRGGGDAARRDPRAQLQYRRRGLDRMSRHETEQTTLERGFSLVEVMISLGILAFGILGLMAGQLAAMGFTANSREHTLAMKLAEEQIETVLAMTPADVLALPVNDPNNPLDPDPGDGNPMEFTRRTIVQDDTPEAGVMTVTVEVDFENRLGNTQTARVQSFKVSP